MTQETSSTVLRERGSPSLSESYHTSFVWEVQSRPLFISVQAPPEQEREKKNAFLETLLQTRGELREACQQLEQLRQEVEERRENGQVSLTGRVG